MRLLSARNTATRFFLRVEKEQQQQCACELSENGVRCAARRRTWRSHSAFQPSSSSPPRKTKRACWGIRHSKHSSNLLFSPSLSNVLRVAGILACGRGAAVSRAKNKTALQTLGEETQERKTMGHTDNRDVSPCKKPESETKGPRGHRRRKKTATTTTI